eukprot:scaffold11901_cov20-Cyclotella_meneghiniana.AAC.1
MQFGVSTCLLCHFIPKRLLVSIAIITHSLCCISTNPIPQNSEKKAKPKGPKPANRTPPKPRKSTSDLSNNSRKSSDGNNNPTGVKTTRGKRGG